MWESLLEGWVTREFRQKLRSWCSPKIFKESRGEVMIEKRPWGSYAVLETGKTYKVKRIEVFPGQRLSYQKHEKRVEHWVIVGGDALITLEGQEIRLSPGQSIDIPRGAAHRMKNPGDDLLSFIEIQTGDSFEEDDIVRLEDDFGRVG
jgi:mannose-6-phosphate isomerase